jgi:hypothetical protein
MLIFYKKRLAFLSVPKTGTTAYETALRDRADMVISEPAMLKHAPVYRYNRFLRPMFFNVCDVELELLAVMREPISWLGSWWRYRQRPFMKGKPNATHGISFDDFVLAYLKGKNLGLQMSVRNQSFWKPSQMERGLRTFLNMKNNTNYRIFFPSG